ncbi:MAG TPA: ATP-dependent DNA helicase RecG [Candidatus Cloacimonetes bacterium]|nr:ATP-dependent DNA helicase RecG [Candidatus Cloacimonadota bacterium]
MAFQLHDNIQFVPGVGPKRAKLLNKLGVKTVKDLLFYFPRDYINKISDKRIADLKINDMASVKGRITGFDTKGNRFQKQQFRVFVSDGSGYLTLMWFRPGPWLIKQFEVGKEIYILGKIQYYYNKLCMTHPDFEIVQDKEKKSFWVEQDILPLYHLTEGISNKVLRKIIRTILSQDLFLDETLPAYIRDTKQLMPLNEALHKIHIPDSNEDIAASRKRFVFEELFFLELMLARKKVNWHKASGYSMELKKTYTTKLKKKLPFTLTHAQKRVLNEIVEDMRSPHQMNRLLQGDVGSGKTIISIFAMLLAIENGFQAAIMAPTEVLATQHYFSLKDFLENFGLRVELLLGGVFAGKEDIKAAIESGDVNIVIGTHSLIQKDVNFHKLGMVVIDEQHRFGVMQRLTLTQKGQTPDKLIMSATPIPRSLALTVYGDLDVSIIDELPPFKKEIYTNWISADKKSQVYDFIKKQLNAGRQVYIVCPLVEESEKPIRQLADATNTYKELQSTVFNNFNVGLLHGRMSNQEKDEIMCAFKEHKIDILVSTTVIEVGIDVPNATIMMIEHAERFGLSQLHQLRGRVGRGAHKSYCVLVAYEPISEEAMIRLNTLKETNDGFRISEVDLELRGPGEFFGTKQSGLPAFRIANIVRDRPILEDARKLAFEIIQNDYNLNDERNRELKEKYKKYYLKRERLFSY